ncbi:MAG: M28 family metallopeptidase [Candidatus Hodarchaeota archaeon]
MDNENKVKEDMRFTIQDICEKIGPRAPCSEQEAACATYIENCFKNYTEDSRIENFYCHPGSYRAAFRIPMIDLIIATISYWIYFFYPNIVSLLISFGFIIFSVIVIQTNLMRNIEFIDPLFKKQKSTNVYGKFKPRETTEQIIVIGGHHDSNWEFPILKKWPKFYMGFMSIPVILSFVMVAVYILKIILYFVSIPFLFVQQVDLGLLILQTTLFPILIYTIIKCVSKDSVMGADDNLTSIAIMLELAKFLKKPNGLKNTEVWLVSHGCEEIGDRGSKRFSKKNLSELRNAYVINIDMVGGKDSELKVDVVEVRSIVKLSKELGDELSIISTELHIPHTVGNVMFYTDSMAYSNNGIKACSLVGSPKKGFATHYHTLNDTIDKLDFNNLWNCYRILIEFIKKVDQKKILI